MSRPTLPALLAALAVVALPAPAFAGDGGAVAPSGAVIEQRAPQAKKNATGGGARPVRRTLLTSFALKRPNLYLYGRAARVNFTLSGRTVAKVRLHVLNASDRTRVATLDLGERAAGSHSVPFTGLEAGLLPEGGYVLHIAGRGLRRGPSASSTAELVFRHHVFPLVGAFSWGGADSRFGARRKGHSHQGQDLAADEGTPVVAPRGGVIEAVEYQASGAGHYVVLDGEDEDHDYVFMHLRTGSIPVTSGQRVRTGQRIGEVGTTGRSSGPHLHFEIWVGGWYAGGDPIDPLPELQAWAAASPASG